MRRLFLQTSENYNKKNTKLLRCNRTGDESKQLNTRADAIRIPSLTHYLLSAPRFKCMLQYA